MANLWGHLFVLAKMNGSTILPDLINEEVGITIYR